MTQSLYDQKINGYKIPNVESLTGAIKDKANFLNRAVVDLKNEIDKLIVDKKALTDAEKIDILDQIERFGAGVYPTITTTQSNWKFDLCAAIVAVIAVILLILNEKEIVVLNEYIYLITLVSFILCIILYSISAFYSFNSTPLSVSAQTSFMILHDKALQSIRALRTGSTESQVKMDIMSYTKNMQSLAMLYVYPDVAEEYAGYLRAQANYVLEQEKASFVK